MIDLVLSRTGSVAFSTIHLVKYHGSANTASLRGGGGLTHSIIRKVSTRGSWENPRLPEHSHYDAVDSPLAIRSEKTLC
jgi:hypothetical protein